MLTYPSPNPKLILRCYQSTIVGLGEGQLRSCSDTDIDPRTSSVGMDCILFILKLTEILPLMCTLLVQPF